MQVCQRCGEENPDRFRVCGMCGAALRHVPPSEEVRRTVSVVFCDLKGSTNLGEQLDTESLREVLNVYFREMQTVLERHGGTVEKYIGDAIMAVFGLPQLHEDDALRAVRAARDMQVALGHVNDRLEAGWGIRLENRTGVNTGEVVAGDVTAGQRLVTGDTVNTAARLEQAASSMEILIGEPTYRLVKDAVAVEPVEPLELKGKAEPVPAYRLVAVADTEDGIRRHLDAPMVGRDLELRALLDALDRVEASHRGELVTILGDAGSGKSRLLREFVHVAGDRINALSGRCLSYGDGITFWPLAEIVREAAGIIDGDSLDDAKLKLRTLAGPRGVDASDRVAAAIGLSEAAFALQELFWGARRLIEVLTHERPTVVIIDDIHWAESTFLDLLEYLADNTEAPLLLLCSARRQLLEDHPGWSADASTRTHLFVDPLSGAETAAVLENLLADKTLETGLASKFIEATGGNPLFIEQMLSMLLETGQLLRDDRGTWVLASADAMLSLPDSISALLNARLDRLVGTERMVIERAAVTGSVFFRDAVEEIVPAEIRPLVDTSLASLAEKDLIYSHHSTLAEHRAFKFAHGLIRDAAYHRLLKRVRAELHERFVDWLERVVFDRVLEFEEIRGYHLEQAYLILIALGPVDDHARAVGTRGAEYLSSAGHRAFARGDMPAASTLLHRAAMLFPVGDQRRSIRLWEAGEALTEVGSFAAADALLKSAIEDAAEHDDDAAELTALVIRLELHYSSEGAADENKLIEQVERAIRRLEELGDHGGLTRAWRLLTQIHWTRLQWGAAEEAAIRMLQEARVTGDSILEARFLPALCACAAYGPTPVDEAVKRCEDTMERVGADRKGGALISIALARLEAMRGNFARARELHHLTRATLEELGWSFLAAQTSLDSGPIEILAGDPAAAERELRRDHHALREMGDHNYVFTVAALLAEAVYQQGRYDEAYELTAESAGDDAPDDALSQYLWRCVRGKILAQRGHTEEAIALLNEAVGIAGASDATDWHAGVLTDLAEVHEIAGDVAAAENVLRQALALFEAKGNTVSADLVRARLGAQKESRAPA
jgi:class 3 adenylate cyclase/tetratricopeptide (TPR) repeat protein